MVGDVEFRDIHFSYNQEKQVLGGFSLKIPAGKRVALCGPSGHGKSTIAALVVRFYDPDGGAVLLDGHDLRNLDSAWLRSQIGYIHQEPVLFSGTLRYNVTYGVDREITPADLEWVKTAAHLEWIDAAGGWDMHVGERGATLSGGQKQRVAIARALLRNPKVTY